MGRIYSFLIFAEKTRAFSDAKSMKMALSVSPFLIAPIKFAGFMKSPSQNRDMMMNIESDDRNNGTLFRYI